MGAQQWHAFFLSESDDNAAPLALIIVNEALDEWRLKQLWLRAELVLCADGGANRLYDALQSAEREHFLPDLIKGDLDSVRDDVRAYYAEQDVEVVLDADQYKTDLGKCLDALDAAERDDPARGEHTLVIVGGLQGRFDQSAHTVHVLHRLRGRRKRTWVLSGPSLACLLDAGAHDLHLDRAVCGPTCGLLPVGVAQATLTTTGLEWDLDGTVSAFGGDMLSTSNHLADDVVHVETDAPIVFTVELRPAESGFDDADEAARRLEALAT